MTDSGSPPDDSSCPEGPGDLPELEVERSGRFERLLNFPGDQELPPRDLVVYLPMGYDTELQRRYPVLYMHDGQNLFDAAQAAFGVEWGVDETMDALVEEGLTAPWIVVAVANTHRRIEEYTPDADPDFGGGLGHRYQDLLVERIKPTIDARYRTLCGPQNTAVAGSSLGGLISFDLFQRHPGVFGRVAAISPSLWWNGGSALQRFSQRFSPVPMRLWLDGGSEEGEKLEAGASSTATNAAAARDRALELGGIFGETVGYLEALGAQHNEAAWAARLPSVLGFILSDAPVGQRPASEVRLHIYRPSLTAGGASDIEVGVRHEGGLWLSWPPGLAQLSVDPPSVAALDGNRLRAISDGVATVSVEVAGVTDQNSVSVGGGDIVTFEVSAPSDTERVHVSGDLDALGAWDGVGVPLSRQGDLWRAEIALPSGRFEYKYTQGGWESVEKAANGDDVQNRSGIASPGATQIDTVERWSGE